MTVLLVTADRDEPGLGSLAAGEPGHEALDAELASRGIEARWVCWDDPEVDWRGADLVAVRSTWDYTGRWAEFLTWARSLDQSRLLNGADVFAWNVDKAYLSRLPDGIGVPTVAPADADELRAAVARFGRCVVKPRTGAGGEGVLVVDDPADPRLTDLRVVVQPLVESVRTAGEVSVYVLDGLAVAQVQKWPVGEEVRVHEHFGGRTEPVDPDPECLAAALAGVAVAAEFGGRSLDYARIDLLHHEGAWRVSEIEATEPGLYLDVMPGNAVPFADLVQRRLG